MENLISGQLAAILRKNRSRYNSLFMMARNAKPSLDHEIFTYYLLDILAPAVDRLQDHSDETVERVTDALYISLLDLMRSNFLGGIKKFERLDIYIKDIVTGLPGFLADQPGDFLRHMTRALIQLCSTPGTRPDDWVKSVTYCGGSCKTYDELLRAGFAAAWQSGMAHYRTKALDIIQTSPPELQRSLLRLKPDGDQEKINTALARMTDNPWISHEQAALNILPPLKLSVVAHAGRFTGYGGVFIRPPKVVTAGSELRAVCGDQAWTLHADCYGQVFLPVDPGSAETARPKSDFIYFPNGTVSYGNLDGVFTELANASSHAALNGTFAVTHPYSHSITLIAAVPA